MQTLLQYLLEGRKENLIIQQFGKQIESAMQLDLSAPDTKLELIQSLKTIDPTPDSKFLLYLAGQYAKGNFRIEDADRVRPALNGFIRFQSTLQKKDINQYKSIHELFNVIEDKTSIKGDVEHDKLWKSQGTEIIIETPNFLVLNIKTLEAGSLIGSGTTWCIRHPESFKRYLESGCAFFVILAKDSDNNTHKFGFHYKTQQLVNRENKNINQSEIKFLSSFPGWFKFIDLMTRTHWTPLN